MKNDLISKVSAIDIVRFECGEWKGLAKTIIKRFEQLPAAQSESKTGKWIEDNEGYFYCDKCGKYPAYQITQTNYCPNCGSYNGGKN